MQSKINAAKHATEAGAATFIINGKDREIISKLFLGHNVGTTFYPKHKISSKRSWLKITQTSGSVVIDDGAKKAIISGKNLLPAGIIDVKGEFTINDVVDVETKKGAFAKAIVDYDSEQIRKAMGKSSSEIKKILKVSRMNVFRRENFVLLS
jgi:glutamate 5-kinase